MRLICLLLAGCASATAEAPLTVPLGIERDAAEQQLHAHQYCRAPGEPATVKEVYPRCDRVQAEVSDSWVTALYDHDKLVELRRWERFADDARAIERWNQMIGDRAKVSQPSDDAAHLLSAKGLEPGTRAMKAFRVDAHTLVGVYLLTPSPPENASVLEKVTTF